MSSGESAAARRAWRAIAAVFLANGLLFSSWVSRIPAIADNLDLGTGMVGLALMSLAIGALIAFPATGRMVQRTSSAQTVTRAAFVMIPALPLVGLAPHLLVLLPVLVVFGAANGAMDVSMNSQGVEVERFVRRTVMNSLHGFFSIGAFVGAAIGALAAWLGLDPAVHFPIMSLIALGIVLWARPQLIPDAPRPASEREPGKLITLPSRSILTLGTLAICTSVSEGAMADWSGLYLHDYLDTSGGVAALGFAVFSVAMLIGRFRGDRAVNRYGPAAVVRAGGTIAAVGLGLAVAINEPWSMLIGFAVVGLGLSVAYPLVFSAAGNHPTLPPGPAVASVATMGYGGFLAGPPVLGWLAEFTSLRLVLVLIAGLCALVAVFGSATRRAVTHNSAAE
ncbi:MAG: MFS transporter [Chloroflexota bacterium]|nr:MFS transporter [Chloroflexota bacterium]